MGKRILFQPSVETSKKKSAMELTRRGNPNVPSGILNCSCFTVHVRPRLWHRPSTTKTRQRESRSLSSNYLSNRGPSKRLVTAVQSSFARTTPSPVPYRMMLAILLSQYQCYAIYSPISNQTKDPRPSSSQMKIIYRYSSTGNQSSGPGTFFPSPNPQNQKLGSRLMGCVWAFTRA